MADDTEPESDPVEQTDPPGHLPLSAYHQPPDWLREIEGPFQRDKDGKPEQLPTGPKPG